MMTQSPLYDLCQNLGPMAVDDFFRLCMYHPEMGYYQQKIPMGAQGDYVTAPEISQVFGELIGLWCMDVWQKLQQPKNIALVELGPGKGSMMADLLKVASLMPDFKEAIEIHLLEASLPLRHIQQHRLASHKITWHEDLTTLPSLPTLFLANEFFDALPHKQYETRNSQWYERLIVCENQNLIWTTANTPSPLPYPAVDQSIIEIPQEGALLLKQMASHLQKVSGATLIIDYGSDINPGYGDTLQALYRHQRCSPFDHLGKSDLTFHVNFHHIRNIFKNAHIPEILFTTQGKFLQNMGIMERTEQLAKKNPHVSLASFRLISAQHMGQLFKVLGACSPDLQLIGFT